MKRIFLLFLCLATSVFSFGQDKPASVAVVSEIPPGPSMKETETWIKRELRAMGSDHIVTKYKGTIWGEKYDIESAVMSECRLTIRQVTSHDEYPSRQTNTNTITLKDVDVGKLLSKEIAAVPGATMSKPSYGIIVVALSDRGDPFLSESDGYAGGKAKKSVRAVRVRVREQKMGNQAVEVFRRAAILCGAPSQPAATAVTEPVEKKEISPTNPASTASSKMTNDEVIQLVTAGLSEQVIITSIRQAPNRDFDVTPTGLIALKKASVPDAVIVVMQEKATPEQAPSASEAKTPPKYDPTLARPEKPPADNGCSGIENLGLYKNALMDPAIGGGLAEWVVKIRNNTGITRIVAFGWRDMYGQQQTAQVQIRGGDIARPRLDLTQARVIPPVTDVRVLSCQ